MKKVIIVVLAMGVFLGGLFSQNVKVQASAPVTVCIDAGHGGTNKGAMYNGYLEKDLTLIIANAMYTELSKYEGIHIIMTRTGDTDISLSDRAEIAANSGADFLYSIHLNASNEHQLFGAEVWTSAFGNQYAKGQTFGNILLQELETEIGVYSKGVKTKLSDKGVDYYGVINSARVRGVAGVILEHCYMDEGHDLNFYSTTESLQALGKADATAVAKYYGLKSSVLGVDFSEYQKKTVTAPAAPVQQDTTPPEVSYITFQGYDSATNRVSLHVTASDSQSNIIFYSFSGDGGQTWSNLWGWTAQTEGNISFVMPAHATGAVCVKMWNNYDLGTQSNCVVIW